MKKKFVSLLLLCSILFPCLLTVACNKKPKPESTEPYSFSVVLKNANGKIDENTLASEYDYSSEKNVDWQKSGNDFTISVIKKGSSSGGLNVHLIEGYDYSNVTLTVNDKQASFDVKSGSISNCGAASYLNDRQLQYAFTNMNSDTKVVIDFSDCNWSKVTIDVSDLRKNNVSYFQVEDKFVTLDMASNLALSAFKTFESDTITVDYGTVFAFDYTEQLAFYIENTRNLEKLNYSTFGSKYFTSKSRVQYLTAKRDGACEVYSVTEDDNKNGTVRILSSSGLSYASSTDNILTNNYILLGMEKERYDGEVLSLSVFKGNQLFIKLDSAAQEFNYFLVDHIDDEWVETCLVEQKTTEDGNVKYLELNLQNADGSYDAAKYLVRKPKQEMNFFTVFVADLPENTRILNYDCIIVGSANRPMDVPSSISDKVFYCYANDKKVDVGITGVISDKITDYVQTNSSVYISGENKSFDGSNARSLAPITANPANIATVQVEAYLDTDEIKTYELKIRYSTNSFTESVVKLDSSDMFLYDGEKVFFTTDILDKDSWSELSSEKNIEISSGIGKAVYYYIYSNRIDATLHIENAAGETVSTTGGLLDCFGRTMTGEIEIDGVKINLTKVYYLEIIPGYYDSYTASLCREYDKTHHSVDLTNISEDMNLMVSFSGYVDKNSFKSISNIREFDIKYDGYKAQGTVFYYIKSATNKYIDLKDKNGKVVSRSELIFINNTAFQIDGYYVYRLSLVADYYAPYEEFTISMKDGKYLLVDNATSATMLIYTDNIPQGSTNAVVVDVTYYFKYDGDATAKFKIVDENGSEIVTSSEIVHIKGLANNQSLYSFKLVFDEGANYVPGSSFRLIKIQ